MWVGLLAGRFPRRARQLVCRLGASRFVPPAGAAATMTIVPSVRPTHLLPPRWCPLVDRTLNVTVEPGGVGPLVADDGRRTRSGNGHGASCGSVQARRLSSLLSIARGTGVPNTVLINRLFRRIHSSTGSSVVSTIYVPLQFAPLSLGVRCATAHRQRSESNFASSRSMQL